MAVAGLTGGLGVLLCAGVGPWTSNCVRGRAGHTASALQRNGAFGGGCFADIFIKNTQVWLCGEGVRCTFQGTATGYSMFSC